MKKTWCILLVICLFSLRVGAQSGELVEWSFSAKAVGENTYEVYMTATMEHLWHIYSQDMEDGGPIPTEISFKENPKVELEGAPREDGVPIEQYEEVFMIDTRYYEGGVHFIQRVKLKRDVQTPVTLEGTVLFMACSGEQCLTPQEVPFKVKLNPTHKQG